MPEPRTASSDRQPADRPYDGPDRRSGDRLKLPPELERRAANSEPAADSGLARHRGPGRRLSAFTKAAEEGEMTPEQFVFLRAIDEFKRANEKPYPSWTDVLEVVRLLGYRKTQASEIRLGGAEDWREKADAPAGVRPDRWAQRAAAAAARRQREIPPDLDLGDFGILPERDAA